VSYQKDSTLNDGSFGSILKTRMTMKNVIRTMALIGMALMFVTGGPAQDWPQWRGSNRDAKATDFKAPKTWPKELTKKWKVTVGDGVATPALVGDRLYVFSREDGNEVTRCLSAAQR